MTASFPTEKTRGLGKENRWSYPAAPEPPFVPPSFGAASPYCLILYRRALLLMPSRAAVALRFQLVSSITRWISLASASSLRLRTRALRPPLTGGDEDCLRVSSDPASPAFIRSSSITKL